MIVNRYRNPVGGTLAQAVSLPQRPDVIAEDGTVYEVVWYPHRDAETLLPGLIARGENHLQERGCFTKSKLAPWSWCG